MSREIMQQALDALQTVDPMDHWGHGVDEAITALEAELAKPEQEPVAWRNAAIRLGEDLYSVGPNGYYDMTAKQWLDWALSVVHTAPPRKEWVGLTDEERNRFINYTDENFAAGVLWAEAKLKEKNGG
jgi:hypothetical protein